MKNRTNVLCVAKHSVNRPIWLPTQENTPGSSRSLVMFVVVRFNGKLIFADTKKLSMLILRLLMKLETIYHQQITSAHTTTTTIIIHQQHQCRHQLHININILLLISTHQLLFHRITCPDSITSSLSLAIRHLVIVMSS